MNIVIHNKVFGVYGPNAAAEQIAFSTHVTAVTPQRLASACMKDINAWFYEKIKSGPTMAVAQSFGYNSNREWAPRTLRSSGTELAITNSFARIFSRNAINIKLPIIECVDICGSCRMGDEPEADLSKGATRDMTQGTETKDMVLPDPLLDVMMAGGLLSKPKAEMEGK